MPAGPYAPPLVGAGGIAQSADLWTMARATRYWQGDALTGDESRPFSVLRQSVAQSIPNNALTPILFDTEDIDIGSGHSTSSNTSRWTCPSTKLGWFRVIGLYAAVSNGTGMRRVAICINGTFYSGNSTTNGIAGIDTTLQASDLIYLNPGDYVEIHAYQTSGGSLNTSLTLSECRMVVTQERIQ